MAQIGGLLEFVGRDRGLCLARGVAEICHEVHAPGRGFDAHAGQGAGVAAAVSLKDGVTVRDVDMATVQGRLKAQGVRDEVAQLLPQVLRQRETIS